MLRSSGLKDNRDDYYQHRREAIQDPEQSGQFEEKGDDIDQGHQEGALYQLYRPGLNQNLVDLVDNKGENQNIENRTYEFTKKPDPVQPLHQQPTPLIAATTRSASRVAATSWTLKIAAPFCWAITPAARLAASRSSGSRPVIFPRKDFLE